MDRGRHSSTLIRPFRECLGELGVQLRPIRWSIVLRVLLGVVEVGASLCVVWLSKQLVDTVSSPAGDPVFPVVMALAGVMLVQILCSVSSRYLEGRSAVIASNSTRTRLFGNVMESAWKGSDRMHSGDSVSRIQEDVRVCSDFVNSTFPSSAVTIVQLIGAAAFLLVLQPDMAWILLLVTPVAVVASRLFFRRMRSLSIEIRETEAGVQQLVQENIQHRVLVKMLGNNSEVLEKLGILQRDVLDKTVLRLNYSTVSRLLMHLGFTGGYLFVFVWGALGIRSGAVTYGMLVAFLQLVGQVQRPVAELARQIPSFIRSLSSADRLLDLEVLQREDRSDPVLIPGAPGIRVEDVSFSYPGAETPVLQSFSCQFLPGTMTVVLGPTGVGKSTLIRLVMALFQPDSGSVTLFDPMSGKQYPSSPRTRCNFMYVPQGNSLMSGTIRENLLSANPEASDEELRAALFDAAGEFVFDLPQALDTPCFEAGGGLSEGQAQRIAVARSLLRPGGILVLDEASSSLDAQTEQTMLSRIFESRRGKKTIICITHREAACAYADDTLYIS